MDQKNTRLSRERVLDSALELADEIGIQDLTIRRLADKLGVGAMTIYHHVPSKDDIIDGMVEIVFTEIEMPPTDTDWKTAMRQRCISARKVLNRHPWAAPLLESRTAPGPASLEHHEAVLASLRGGGLTLQLAAHAYAILDSFVYGFAFEEATLPVDDAEGFTDVAREIAAHFPAETYPHLAELTFDHVLQPGYNFGDSFEFGLDLILDGLDRAARTERATA